MRMMMAVVLGLGLAVNGVWMLLSPESWYPVIPGVTHTGPLNVHFVRDIGCAYFLCGSALLGLAIAPVSMRPAAWLAVAFLALHAGVHVADAIAGRSDLPHLLRDIPLVFVVPLLALWLTWTMPPSAMLMKSAYRWLADRRMRAFERQYEYDMGYVREILRVSPAAFAHYLNIAAMARHNEDVPPSAWFAAKLAAVIAEDCGPCTQLVADMAIEAGIPAATVAAIVGGDEAAMDRTTALGWRFARAALAHEAGAAALRDDIRAQWGERALVSLALAIVATRSFPTFKYALGHGLACTRVRVADCELAPARPA